MLGVNIYMGQHNDEDEEDPDAPKQIETIKSLDAIFYRQNFFSIDSLLAEAAIEKIVDTAESKLPTFETCELEAGNKVLLVEESTKLQIEIEVIRYPIGNNRFNYYGVASKISGDLLYFIKVFTENFKEGI